LKGLSTSYGADLELARRCAAGDEQAWERFVLEYRPILYRAADALDPSGGARDLADSLYADLYGIPKGHPAAAPGEGAARKSLLHYFQGRSSLATWLRAVLAQRYVDRIRAERRLAPLPSEERASEAPGDSSDKHVWRDAAHPPTADPDRPRHMLLMQQALGRAIADLQPRDRLRLACYYAQSLTLAETGRLLKEHEATVSRQLARTRRAIREHVERWLRSEAGMSDREIAQCFESSSEDPGPIDLDQMLAASGVRKETVPERSK